MTRPIPDPNATAPLRQKTTAVKCRYIYRLASTQLGNGAVVEVDPWPGCSEVHHAARVTCDLFRKAPNSADRLGVLAKLGRRRS